MAKRTIKRVPFSVPTPDTKDGYFNQLEFKGICDDRNDVTIDQQSFAEATNVYVDDSNVLTSRPPLKFFDGEAYIVEQWIFGDIGLRLYRLKEGDNFLFLLKSFTHFRTDIENNAASWLIPIESIGYDFIPVTKLIQIEDKIYIWFGGISFYYFNTIDYHFGNALQYLYFPVHKLVINGIESELETKNFLTETYRKRHQYSAVSSINFERLIGRKIIVNLNGVDTQNKSNHLYDIEVQKHQEKMLISPYSPMGSNFFVDIAQTPRATVVLRYSPATKTIEVSFDGKSFRPLPSIEDIVGDPQLTKDGMWVVVFTKRGLGKCRIVASETADFMEPERVMSWEVDPYLKKVIRNGIPLYLEELDPGFIPQGYFETIDIFTYVFKGPSVYSNISQNIIYAYAEWLAGTNEVWGYDSLISGSGTGLWTDSIDDDIKIHFRYSPPTIKYNNLPCVITILAPVYYFYTDTTVYYQPNSLLQLYFERDTNANPEIYVENNQRLVISENGVAKHIRYIHKLTPNGLNIDSSDSVIRDGDIISYTAMPLNVSIDENYSVSKTYFPDDVVTYQGYRDFPVVFYCLQENTGQVPPNTGSGDAYWQSFTYTDGTSVTSHSEEVEWEYNDDMFRAYLDWKWGFLSNRYTRFIIRKADKTTGPIKQGDLVELTPYPDNCVFSIGQLNVTFGEFPVGRGGDGGDLTDTKTWRQFIGNVNTFTVNYNSTLDNYDGIIGVSNKNNTANVTNTNLMAIYQDINDRFYSSCKQFDMITFAPETDNDNIIFKTIVACNLYRTGYARDIIADCRYDYTTDTETKNEVKDITQTYMSNWFKLQSGTSNILTDKSLRIDETFVSLPQNGELYPLIDDPERRIASNDNLVLAYSDGVSIFSYDRNIHKLTDDGINLSSTAIQSGDIVSYTSDAITEKDYLTPDGFTYNSATSKYEGISNRFIIQKLGLNSTGTDWVVISGQIRSDDVIRLISHTDTIILPVGNSGNPFNYTLVINPQVYPTTPGGWHPGDPWPSNFPTHPPLVVDQGDIRVWSADYADPLPVGPIQRFGVTNIFKRIKPLSIDSNGVWYDIDGTLWTSETSTNSFLELDEYINAEVSNIGGSNTRWFPSSLNFRRDIPDYVATLNEHYMSFVTAQEGLNLLQITAMRRDEYKLFTKEGRDFLIYLPKLNEQQFAKKITNLHTLSESEMGIFTQDEIWYTQWTGSAYTRPVKSKIPTGCRDGSNIITALDGKVIIFTTSRGVTALSPQDFVASTEQTLSYLSDSIQSLYQDFYNTPVHSTTFIPSEFQYGYKPEVKIVTYKYWIIFHRYMDRIVLAFDTRTATWWKWETPYPIRSMMVGSRLHFLMQIDYNPISDMAIHYPPLKESLFGVDFVWADREVDNVTYYDSYVPNTLNGYSEWIPDPHTGGRRQLFYADPMIKWSITSQRLHFNKINNYKHVKAMSMIAKGDTTMTAKLTTKVYRDFYHPERSDVMEIPVNNLTTFVRRVNIMHFMNFQYKLETDTNNEMQSQLKLNSLGIKYEVKEEI